MVKSVFESLLLIETIKGINTGVLYTQKFDLAQTGATPPPPIFLFVY